MNITQQANYICIPTRADTGGECDIRDSHVCAGTSNSKPLVTRSPMDGAQSIDASPIEYTGSAPVLVSCCKTPKIYYSTYAVLRSGNIGIEN